MRVLIVGQLNNHALTAAKIAIKKGAKVRQVSTIEEALTTVRQEGGDIILVDLVLDIKTLTTSLNNERIHIPVVACGIAANAEQAASAIHQGALEYLPLPPNAEMIAAVFEAITRDSTSVTVNDPSMQKVIHLVERIAPSDASVLLTGESGTGKEVFARLIHQKSKRVQHPFICVNCAAIPEHLLESELFGHEKGAFTGAIARRIGKFEEANNGTLLLDEITEMHPRLQAKLLRAIQERVIDRLGGTAPVHVNIRILATSNRDMIQAVKDQVFREDLYFRLNVVNIAIPPLRERVGDILPLSQYFMRKYAENNQLSVKAFSKEAEAGLMQYNWPGNVRELENTIHRAVLLSGDVVELDDLQLPQNREDSSKWVGSTMKEAEQSLIQDTLKHCLGNREHAARILGISIRALREKLGEYEMMIPAKG